MAKIADVLGGVRAIRDTDRVTTFELIFDLVFVFAVTQVTAFMAHEHDAIGLVRGLLILALPRAGLAVAFLALWPAAAAAPPLLALGAAVAMLGALVALELTRAPRDRQPVRVESA